MKEKRKGQPHAQKQECGCPSLQASLRIHTLAFLAPLMLLSMVIRIEANGQTPVTPKPSTLNPNTIIGFPNGQQGGKIINQANPLDIYEQDRMNVERRNAMLNNENSELRTTIYDLPSFQHIPSTVHYRDAFEKISGMLSGKKPMSLKQAIFTLENAYFQGNLDYKKYDKEIQSLITTAKLKAAQDGYDWNNPQTRNVMLFRVMADTLKVKLSAEESYFTSYPLKYDFDDYSGKQDWSKMFVTKLLYSKSGQCHSLPLLYLVLCEETKTPANLAFSPSHTYAKFKDQSGNWHNLELTNGRIVSDAFILGSGYITAEALKKRIYMEPLTTKQTIAQCLADLAKGYARKYGYDSFVGQCTDTVLKYDNTSIFALQLKSDYQTLRFEYVVNQVGRPHPEVLKANYPNIYQLLLERNLSYQLIDASGYREMPENAYSEWLKSVDREKEKQVHQGQMLRLTRTIK